MVHFVYALTLVTLTFDPRLSDPPARAHEGIVICRTVARGHRYVADSAAVARCRCCEGLKRKQWRPEAALLSPRLKFAPCFLPVSSPSTPPPPPVLQILFCCVSAATFLWKAPTIPPLGTP